jgi:ribosomal protein L37AE/L43A
MNRERKVCPYCKSTTIQKRRHPPNYICNKCKMTFLTPMVLVMDYNIGLPKYLKIKKDDTDGKTYR